MSGVVTQQGAGKWRHQVTSLVVEPGAADDMAQVSAYGLVTDWGTGGQLVNFFDYAITLNRADGAWRIRSLVATTP